MEKALVIFIPRSSKTMISFFIEIQFTYIITLASGGQILNIFIDYTPFKVTTK